MKKAGKIIAAIFASICIIVSLITAGIAAAGKFAQENPELIQENMEQAGVTVSESDKTDLEAFENLMKDVDFGKVISQGLVGAFLSVIVLITVLINVSKIPILTPAIASVAALVGAIYCGWLIAFFMVVALIGSVLVLIAKLQESRANSES